MLHGLKMSPKLTQRMRPTTGDISAVRRFIQKSGHVPEQVALILLVVKKHCSVSPKPHKGLEVSCHIHAYN